MNDICSPIGTNYPRTTGDETSSRKSNFRHSSQKNWSRGRYFTAAMLNVTGFFLPCLSNDVVLANAPIRVPVHKISYIWLFKCGNNELYIIYIWNMCMLWHLSVSEVDPRPPVSTEAMSENAVLWRKVAWEID